MTKHHVPAVPGRSLAGPRRRRPPAVLLVIGGMFASFLSCAKYPVDQGDDTAGGQGGTGSGSGGAGSGGEVAGPAGSGGTPPSAGSGGGGSMSVAGAGGRGGTPVAGSNGMAGAAGMSTAGSGGRAGAAGAMVAGMGGRAGAGGAAGAAAGAGGSMQGTGGTGLPPIQNGCQGYATRFWDCCKPHCAWPGNVGGGGKAVNTCSAQNNVVNSDTQSSCNGGGGHMCYGLTPWAVNSNLAYGFAATSSGDVCGRCFQLQFTGSSHNAGNDPGSAALAGKTMVVQAVNVGYDVAGGQFDIAIPGGGVGAFNACSAQWGVSNSDLGAQYGGLLSYCKQQFGSGSLDALKTCMLDRCMAIFQSRGLSDLAAGCRFYAEWFQAADNPSLKYKEIACPAAIVAKSGMNRGGVDNRCGN